MKRYLLKVYDKSIALYQYNQYDIRKTKVYFKILWEVFDKIYFLLISFPER